MKKPVASLALILAAGLFAASVQAATVTEQIQTTVRTLVTQWNAGNVKAAAATFGDDAQIAGEGMPAAVTGRAAIDKKFAELIDDTGKVQIDVQRVLETGPKSGMAWVLWRVAPKDPKGEPFTVRSLFVFSGRGDGFKIRADSYSVGQY